MVAIAGDSWGIAPLPGERERITPYDDHRLPLHDAHGVGPVPRRPSSPVDVRKGTLTATSRG
jgi:hypothetical protein